MYVMTLNKKAIIYTLSPIKGGGGYTKANSKSVWVAVQDVGAGLKFSALSAGVDLTAKAVMYRKEYESNNYTHLTINNVDYRIIAATYADNDLYITLQLSRG